MKVVMSIIVMVFFCFRIHAQSQELEQLRLDLEKLVQFKLILSQMKQGYQTLQNGYNAVRDAAKGNYHLHSSYLNGLWKVNASVKNAPALKRIIDNHTILSKEYRVWFSRVRAMGVFKAAELSVIQDSCRQMIAVLSDHLDQLQILLTPGQLRMSDGERMAAIEVLAEKSDQLLVALRRFTSEQTAIAAGRIQNEKDRQAMLRLYGLH